MTIIVPEKINFKHPRGIHSLSLTPHIHAHTHTHDSSSYTSHYTTLSAFFLWPWISLSIMRAPPLYPIPFKLPAGNTLIARIIHNNIGHNLCLSLSHSVLLSKKKNLKNKEKGEQRGAQKKGRGGVGCTSGRLLSLIFNSLLFFWFNRPRS